MFRDSFFSGGCYSWLNFLTNNLVVLLEYNIPVSVSLTAVSDTHLSLPVSVNCNDYLKVQKIFSALRSPQLAGSSFDCNGYHWKVRQCGANKPAICVNCGDPCNVRACNGSNPFFISPCLSPLTSCPASQLYSRYFNVTFVLKYPVPRIDNFLLQPSATSATVSLNLSTNAFANCGAIATGTQFILADLIPYIYVQHQIMQTVDKKTSLTVFNLQPRTSYTMYCVTEGSSGTLINIGESYDASCKVPSALENRRLFELDESKSEVSVSGLPSFNEFVEVPINRRLTAATNVTSINSAVQSLSFMTSCCDTLNVLLNILEVYRNTDQVNIAVISLNFPVKEDLTVSYNFTNEGNLVFNSSFSFSYDGDFSPFQISISREYLQLAGNYTLSVSVDNPYYVVSYARNRNVFLVKTESEYISPPQLVSAFMAYSATEVVLEFDSPSNRAFITSDSFHCSVLLAFIDANTTTCSWMDDSSIVVHLRGDSTLLPNDSITLNGTELRAKCIIGDYSICLSWPSLGVVSTNITLLPNTENYMPFVVINIPAIVATFSNISIDLTNSQGHGSRPWKSANFTVSGSNSSSAARIEGYLNKNYKILPPSYIPSRITISGAGFYNIVVKLCNFLNFCGWASQTVTIIENYYPQTSIIGPTVAKVFNNFDITLTSNALVYVEEGNNIMTSRENISYLWTLEQSDMVIHQEYTPQFTGFQYLIPAYYMKPNKIYRFTVSALSLRYSKASSAMVSLQVMPGKIIAVLSGGEQQMIKVNGSLDISAAASFVQDQMPSTYSLSYLSFSWKCFQYYPFYSPKCSFTLLDTLVPYNITLVSSNSSGITGSRISVTVFDSTRFATRSVDVMTYSDMRPVVSIDAQTVLLSAGTVNPSQILKLGGIVDHVNVMNANCSLAVNDSAIDLTTAAFTPIPVVYKVGTGSLSLTQLPIYFGVSTKAFPQYGSFRFTISCMDDRLLSSSNFIDLVMNSPPSSGSLTVSPSGGMELTDLFQIVAANWYDDNLPLSYYFGYMDHRGNIQTLQEVSTQLFAYTKLTRVNNKNINTVNVVVYVFDRLAATSISSKIALVSKAVSGGNSGSSHFALLEHFLEDQSSLSYSSLGDVTLQSVSLGITYLNNHLDIDNSTSSAKRSALASQLLNQSVSQNSSFSSKLGFLSSVTAITEVDIPLWIDSFESALNTVNSVVQATVQKFFTWPMLSSVSLLADRLTEAMSINRTLATNENFNRLRRFYAHLNALALEQFVLGQAQVSYQGAALTSTVTSSYLNISGMNNIVLGSLFENNEAVISFNNSLATWFTEYSWVSYNYFGSESNPMMTDSLVTISPPLTVQFNDASFCFKHNCNVSLVFNHYENETYNQTLPHVTTTYCAKGRVQQFIYPCNGGTNYSVTCDGIHGGFVNSSCPYEVSYPYCNAEYITNSQTVSVRMCEVVSFNSSFTQCACFFPSAEVTGLNTSLLAVSFSAVKRTDRYSNRHFSSSSAYLNVATLFPFISFTINSTMTIENATSTALSGTDVAFLKEIYLISLSNFTVTVNFVSRAQFISAGMLVLSVGLNVTSNTFCTAEHAAGQVDIGLQQVVPLYNSNINSSMYEMSNTSVLRFTSAVNVSTVFISNHTSETSSLQKKYCRDSVTGFGGATKNVFVMKSLSSIPTQFSPFDFAMTYTLALLCFLFMSVAYLYLSNTTRRVDFIDKRIEQAFPTPKKPLLPTSAVKADEAVEYVVFKDVLKSPQMGRQGVGKRKKGSPDFATGLADTSFDLQYSNLFELTSDFQYRNKRRQQLKSFHSESNHSISDRHQRQEGQTDVGQYNNANIFENTAIMFDLNQLDNKLDDDLTYNRIFGPSKSSPDSERDLDEFLTRFHSSHHSSHSNRRLFNDLSFYNGEFVLPSVSGDGGAEDGEQGLPVEMIANPLKGARNIRDFALKGPFREEEEEPRDGGEHFDFPKNSPDNNDTAILFGSKQLDEQDDDEDDAPNETPGAGEAEDASLSPSLYTKTKIAYYLNKFSPPKKGTPSPPGSNDQDDLSSVFTRDTWARNNVYADSDEINLSKRQSLAYYMNKLNPLPRAGRPGTHKRLATPESVVGGGMEANIDFIVPQQNNDTSIVFGAEKVEEVYPTDEDAVM